MTECLYLHSPEAIVLELVPIAGIFRIPSQLPQTVAVFLHPKASLVNLQEGQSVPMSTISIHTQLEQGDPTLIKDLHICSANAYTLFFFSLYQGTEPLIRLVFVCPLLVVNIGAVL